MTTGFLASFGFAIVPCESHDGSAGQAQCDNHLSGHLPAHTNTPKRITAFSLGMLLG